MKHKIKSFRDSDGTPKCATCVGQMDPRLKRRILIHADGPSTNEQTAWEFCCNACAAKFWSDPVSEEMHQIYKSSMDPSPNEPIFHHVWLLEPGAQHLVIDSLRHMSPKHADVWWHEAPDVDDWHSEIHEIAPEVKFESKIEPKVRSGFVQIKAQTVDDLRTNLEILKRHGHEDDVDVSTDS